MDSPSDWFIDQNTNHSYSIFLRVAIRLEHTHHGIQIIPISVVLKIKLAEDFKHLVASCMQHNGQLSCHYGSIPSRRCWSGTMGSRTRLIARR